VYLASFRATVLSPGGQAGFSGFARWREKANIRGLGQGRLHLLPPTVSGLQQPSGFLIAFAQPLSPPFSLAFLPVEIFVLKELALTRDWYDYWSSVAFLFEIPARG
jgi:hypothetical protein